MTLINIEGFEARSSRMGWTHNNFSTAGRFGGICAHTGSATYRPPFALDEAIVGFALRIPTGGHDAFFQTFTVSNPNDYNMCLYIRADMHLSIHRYNVSSGTRLTPIAISDGPLGNPGQWIYMEVRSRNATVGGYFDVYVNGTPFLSYAGNTIGSGDGVQNGHGMFLWSNTGATYIDDVYICDRLGSEYNNLIGEIQVEGLFPNGNGIHSQWVGSDGNSVDNYLLVDEAPAVETDLVQSDVVGAKDTYQFTNLAIAQGQILAVQPSISISKTNAGPAAAKLIDRLANGTERKSAAYLASNMMAFGPLPMTRDPEGAIWTADSINAAEFGVEVA